MDEAVKIFHFSYPLSKTTHYYSPLNEAAAAHYNFVQSPAFLLSGAKRGIIFSSDVAIAAAPTDPS